MERRPRRAWTIEEDELLRELYPEASTAELAVRFGRSLSSVYGRSTVLKLSKSAAYLASAESCRLRRGDEVGAATRFKPGFVPYNKGLRRPGYAPGRMRETMFKRGVRGGVAARRWKPVDSTRLIDGYLYRKVSDLPGSWTINWKLEHILVWSRAHGPAPQGHVVIFRNGNKTDIRLENLECVSRRELMARNTVHNLPPPLAASVQLLSALNRKIRRLTREEQDHRSS